MTDGDFTVAHDDSLTIGDTYDYFQGVCTLARSLNVDVYTVGLRASALTDNELTKCAGSTDKYFPVNSGSQLVDAFEKIAENAARVRLSH